MTMSSHRCAAVLFAVAVSTATPLAAQPSGVIRGRVVDAKGPVADVALQLRAATNEHEHLTTRYSLTDARGTFLLRAVPVGRWVMEARRVGYVPSTQRLTVRAGETTTVDLSMQAVAQSLDTVNVVQWGVVPERYGPSSRMHEFYRRRARGHGRFFTRDDIEASGRAKLTDLLRTVPGARIRTYPGNRAEVAFARCTGPVQLAQSGSLTAAARGQTGSRGGTVALYVNGVRIDTASIQQTFAEFDLMEIEAVEVYRGISELPPEAVGDACSAIFVWTRFGPGEPAPPPNVPREGKPDSPT